MESRGNEPKNHCCSVRTGCFVGYIYAIMCDVRVTIIFGDDGQEGRIALLWKALLREIG